MPKVVFHYNTAVLCGHNPEPVAIGRERTFLSHTIGNTEFLVAYESNGCEECRKDAVDILIVNAEEYHRMHPSFVGDKQSQNDRIEQKIDTILKAIENIGSGIL